MTMRRAICVLATMVVLSGCDSLDPLIVQLQDDRGAAAKVAGSWTGNATVSAQSLAFTLTVQDTTVTGTGSYSAETHGGNLDVQGSATRSGVRRSLSGRFEHGALRGDAAQLNDTDRNADLPAGERHRIIPGDYVHEAV